jgi:hypothetical protein
VTSIAPASGTTIGGSSITVTGSNFAAGATVTLGGVPATGVTVVNASTITATTAAHASGAVDVVVALNGKTGMLPGGYTYVAPQTVTNPPPVIVSLTAKGLKPREPAGFADVGEGINVTAAVSDAETPLSGLTLAWSADAGTFSGNGATTTWTAPASFATPATIKLTLTVTERYQTTDSVGLPVTRENVVTGSTSVRLHNSVKEVGDLAVDFLEGFSKQLDPNYVLRNFTSTCPTAADERNDVVNQQRDYTVTAYKLGTPSTTVGFTGHCPFRNVFGDACAQVPATWTSIYKPTGKTGTVSGTDQVTALLENDQWRLCASDWDQTSSTFIRGLTFMR